MLTIGKAYPEGTKTVLVTGGAGYIGSHTCVELINNGYRIVVFDNFSNSKIESLKRIHEITDETFRVFNGDIRDKYQLNEVFAECEIHAVIHFAGLKAVGESSANPLKYYDNNVHGTLTLLEVMKAHNVKNIIFSSSACVYHPSNPIPYKEDMPLGAANPYGWTKMMTEQIISDVCSSDPEWSAALLRYFNPIGAHESGLMGENPNGVPNNLMPYITQVAVGEREFLSVFGDDYDTVDGTGMRDYIHVVDLAQGHIKALEKVMELKGVNAYNLGTGRPYSVLEVIAAFEKAASLKIPYKIMPRRAGDIDKYYSDSSKANEELNWTATRDLDKMCQDSWRWQQANPKGYE